LQAARGLRGDLTSGGFLELLCGAPELDELRVELACQLQQRQVTLPRDFLVGALRRGGKVDAETEFGGLQRHRELLASGGACLFPKGLHRELQQPSAAHVHGRANELLAELEEAQPNLRQALVTHVL